MRARRYCAFTLIELLVVIAIITVLMGVMMPALSRVKEQGKEAVCRNNLKQIGMGASMYADDWGLLVPRGAARNQAWYTLFMRYLAQTAVNNRDYRTVKIYRCPSYPDKEQTVCYVVNGWEFSSRTDTAGEERTEPSRITEARRPAETIYLVDNEDGTWRDIITTISSPGIERCDVWSPSHLPHPEDDETAPTGDASMYGRRVAATRHKQAGCSTLYLDWHVDYVAARDMTIDMWRWKK